MLLKKIPLLDKTKISHLDFNLLSLPELTLNQIPDEVKAQQTILLTAEVEEPV